VQPRPSPKQQEPIRGRFESAIAAPADLPTLSFRLRFVIQAIACCLLASFQLRSYALCCSFGVVR